MKNEHRFENAFDAIANTPQEAMNLKLRSRLMDVLIDRIKDEKWTQPRISDLCRGKISLFSLDALVNMLAVVGDFEIVIKRAA